MKKFIFIMLKIKRVLRDKKARPGRNPKTGEDVMISSRRVVTFRAGQKLKARVENNAISNE